MSSSAEVERAGDGRADEELVRLAVSMPHPRSQRPMGIFQVAYRLRRYTVLDGPTRRAIDDELSWFQAHLPEPSRFVRTTAKGYYRRDTIAVSWFKPEATLHRAHAEALGRALAVCGVPVHTLRTRHPGYVVYEDDYQVVAVPFRDR